MSEPKHTPGPWRIKHGTNVFGVRRDVGHEGSVCTTGGHGSNQVDCTPENEANARLIAAAPDLLVACERAESLLGELRRHLPNLRAVHCANVLETIRNAIAKAVKKPE